MQRLRNRNESDRSGQGRPYRENEDSPAISVFDLELNRNICRLFILRRGFKRLCEGSLDAKQFNPFVVGNEFPVDPHMEEVSRH